MPQRPRKVFGNVSHELGQAEADFSRLVHSFIFSFRPDRRPFVTRLCQSWCQTWAEQPVPLPLPPQNEAVRALAEEVYRLRWRLYYGDHKERITARQREDYRHGIRKRA